MNVNTGVRSQCPEPFLHAGQNSEPISLPFNPVSFWCEVVGFILMQEVNKGLFPLHSPAWRMHKES